MNLGAGSATGTGGFIDIGSFVGGSGSDALTGPDVDAVWQIAGNSGSVGSVAFANFENLTGSDGNDTFVLSAADPALTLDGGGGDDLIQGPDTASTYAVTAADEGSVNGSAFRNVENLFGGIRHDEFVYAFGAFLSGAAAGGGGLDRLRAGNDRNAWRLLTAGNGTLNGQDFTGFEILEGGTGEDTLVEARPTRRGRSTALIRARSRARYSPGWRSWKARRTTRTRLSSPQVAASLAASRAAPADSISIVIGPGDYSVKVYTMTGPDLGVDLA